MQSLVIVAVEEIFMLYTSSQYIPTYSRLFLQQNE